MNPQSNEYKKKIGHVRISGKLSKCKKNQVNITRFTANMLTLVPKIRKRAGCKEKFMQMLKDYVNISLFAAVIVDWVHWAVTATTTTQSVRDEFKS